MDKLFWILQHEEKKIQIEVYHKRRRNKVHSSVTYFARIQMVGVRLTFSKVPRITYDSVKKSESSFEKFYVFNKINS